MTELLVVDDHPILRQGLVQFLAGMPDVACVNEASNGREALAQFRCCRPDAVILDLSLGAESGLDVLQQMLAIDDAVPVLILTMHDESLHAERALAAGARGYVMKHEATSSVIEAVRRLLAGELVFSRQLQESVLLHFSHRTGARQTTGVGALTSRELEVLELIGKGLATCQIAAHLSRSVKTVDAHRASIRGKLGINSTFELMHFAMNWSSR